MRHLDLFSGIGGFALAASWVWGAEHEVVAFCEIEPYCQAVLRDHWPDVPIIEDVRDVFRFAHEYEQCPNCLDEPWCARHGMHYSDCQCIGPSQWSDEYGEVDIITGGDPCQRHSNANRSGTLCTPSMGDEFIRIVSAIMPRWVVRENPSVVRGDAPWPGWRFAAALESLGYVATTFRFRACCVGAEHRRERLCVLAALPNADGKRLERNVSQVVAHAGKRGQNPHIAGPDWRTPTPRICGRTDGIPNVMDRLKALGNAIVPQAVVPIMEAIKGMESAR